MSSALAQAPAAAPTSATTDADRATIKELVERVIALEGQVRMLQHQGATNQGSGAAGAPSQAADTGTPPESTSQAAAQGQSVASQSEPVPAQTTEPAGVYGGASSMAKALNPDIGIIGNFVSATGRNRINPSPSFTLQESEVSLQAVVDPYARADFFLAFGEEGVEVEEGYVTFTAMPGGFVPRLGKMRAAFGRVNSFHNHNLPWVDRPLVTFNLMGGSLDEADIGIKDAGMSVSRVIPAPGGLFLEGTGQVFRGDSGSLFQASRRSDVAVVGHLKAYKDLTESTNLELGGSYARGHNDAGADTLTQLYGMDATFRWRPLRRSIYRSFAARTEVMWSDREQAPLAQHAFGLYASTEYQFARRWQGGLRFDWSERARNAALHDSGQALVLTFSPSEYNQIRGQFRRTQYAEGQTSNELLMQVLFTLGAHGAHPF
ncbi:MAG: hypothetical protein HYX28_07320 [Candidatus Koribacter versatilis]|uniref:Zinc-regulated TonB-dependent outer membrane receptor n=1 Tax=Candidatus Korobacter versatilis TaxID=658062 RepID=A0A932A8C1_9BACT|nr:hypothetical protein [Candidatus Koribacter versatilis]